MGWFTRWFPWPTLWVNYDFSHWPIAVVGNSIWLWPTVCHGSHGPFIEIDGLPFLKNGGSFHGYVSHNQMVFQFIPGWWNNPSVETINVFSDWRLWWVEHVIPWRYPEEYVLQISIESPLNLHWVFERLTVAWYLHWIFRGYTLPKFLRRNPTFGP